MIVYKYLLSFFFLIYNISAYYKRKLHDLGGIILNHSIKKKELDMLNGSIWNKIPRFAVPVAATGILEQLFNASDLAIVGNFATGDRTVAVAAVGANSSIIGLLLNLFIGIALGANVVIANAIGQKDEKTIKKSVHTSIIMAVLGGLIVAVLGELFIAPFMGFLHVPDDVFPYALLYLRIYLLGMPAILLYNFESAIFRSVGETKMPLKALAISGVLNVLLNLFFVLVLKMTVNGVALATVLSNVISSILLFRKLLRTTQPVRVERKYFRFDPSVFKRILQIGLPTGLQSAVFAIANIAVQSAINSLGTLTIAASSAAFNLEIFAYYIFNSFSQACTTFVGQNYGAGNIKRCKKTLLLCMTEGLIATAITITLVLIFGRPLLAIFNQNPEVIDIGYVRLVYIFPAYIFSLLYDNMSGYLRGFGISLMPALLTTVSVCGVRIFTVCSVFPKHRTFETIMLAYPISLGLAALCIFFALMYYRPSKRFARSV